MEITREEKERITWFKPSKWLTPIRGNTTKALKYLVGRKLFVSYVEV